MNTFISRGYSTCVKYNLHGRGKTGYVEFELSNIGKVLRFHSFIDKSSGLQELLQVCARNKSLALGKSCHALAIQFGLVTDTLTCNILINFYSMCGLIDYARQTFDRMPSRSIVSWNTIIATHTRHGEDAEALRLFVAMHRGGMSPSEFTLSSVLCACAAKSSLVECKELHALALKTAMESNVFVGTAVLDVYAKCNMISDACWVFDTMPERSSVTWSSMAAGYMHNELHEEALSLFRRAQRMGVELTQFTLSATLSASGGLSAMIEGTQLHALVIKSGFDSDIYVATSLIDTYSKCGHIEESYTVFAYLEEKNIVLWNAMMAGLSRHACYLQVMILFEKLHQMGMHANEVTYVSVLSACGHVGLVDKGRRYFDLMNRDAYVQPNALHYSCMVDILGRAGLVSEAWELIQRMPFRSTASMWGSLLGSCRIHGNVQLAKVAAEHLFQIEPHNAGNHVLLSNVYAANKKWEEVALARKLLKDSGAKKETGKSWIEVKDQVHIFVVGEGHHPRISDVYVELENLRHEMMKLDYKVETKFDLHDVEEDQKEELLRHHSEKLALAFGLISLPLGIPIRINKNLRVCGDCHSFMKLASRVTYRKIILRDTNRFHHFSCGLCSCGDFW